jgi:uncharacterized lipoprotein YbaY
MEPPLLRGEVVFEEGALSFDGATLFISLSDTSYADAPAEAVASEVLPNVSYDARARNRLPFTLHGHIREENADYTVSVHVDMDGDGKVGAGDFVNVQSYPVLTHGHPDFVSVLVKRIP